MINNIISEDFDNWQFLNNGEYLLGTIGTGVRGFTFFDTSLRSISGPFDTATLFLKGFEINRTKKELSNNE